jgi:hypothetical protein
VFLDGSPKSATCIRAESACEASADVNEAKRDISYTPGGLAQLTPSESSNAHVIVVKDQREAINNAFHARRVDVQASHPAPTVRLPGLDGKKRPEKLMVGIYDIFIERSLSCVS